MILRSNNLIDLYFKYLECGDLNSDLIKLKSLSNKGVIYEKKSLFF